MLVLKQRLQQHGLTQSALATAVGISEAALAQIVNHNQWPKQESDAVRERICTVLEKQGMTTAGCFEVVRESEAPSRTGTTTTFSSSIIHEDDEMILRKQVLTPAAKKHFGLVRNPFDDYALRSSDDVFKSPDIHYVREAMYQTARFGGFLAIVGESGSGKSTLRRDLIDRIRNSGDDITVIEPYVLAMEDNDRTGQTLKAASIAEAIIREVAPTERPKLSREARFSQVHRVLKENARASSAGGRDNAHVLIIEEAHSLPQPTLKHLKRFLELEDGHRKLLSIILIGQPELELSLSGRNAAVREVVQRCEVVNLPHLGDNLEAFLAFKFQRAGGDVARVLEASAINEIRNRLCLSRNGGRETVSLLYPLAIANLVTAAMNMAARDDIPRVDANVIKLTGK
ncbi:TPA: AAA family ATPase [Klebsiella pneumoniae]|nr:AAA family ATPase [Klebsiella pneumoniae]